nr:uncharacterized protein LOC111428395 isoform X1 [Onthophagus taurus]
MFVNNFIFAFFITTLINFAFTSSLTISKEELDRLKSSCKEDFCESVENYPEILINQLLKQNDAIAKEYFNGSLPPNITNRDNIEFTNMCEVSEYIVGPKIFKDTKNIPRIIVNTEEYHQYVLLKTCGSKDGDCTKTPIPGHEVRCIPEKINIKLIFLDEGPSFGVGSFDMYGGCACAYKSITHNK